MPLEDPVAVAEPAKQLVLPPRLGDPHRLESQFSDRGPVDPRVERPSQHLGAEADAEHRQTGINRPAHQPPLRHQVRIAVDLVHVHLAAKYDQSTDLFEVGPHRPRIEGVQPANRNIVLAERRLGDAERVVPVVSNAQYRLHTMSLHHKYCCHVLPPPVGRVGEGVAQTGGAMKIGLTIPDFSWPGGPTKLGSTMAQIARTADQAGFESIWVMDHFWQIRGNGPPEHDMLEGYSALAFMAALTSRARLGTMVTGAVYRYPGVLAKTVTTLDVLSGGRAWLGIGAAWNEAESRGLGIPFPPIAERFERLEETLQICLTMWEGKRGSEKPFPGKHYQLARPLNVPQSLSRPHPPILIGGGGERKTLRMVARYGQACNLFPGPDLAHKLDVLRAHCDAEGRDYDEIEKTCYFIFDVGEKGEKAGEVIDQLGQLAGLGFQAAIGSVVDVWQVSPLEAIGNEVIPAVAGL